jgi:hypothetical protein
MTYSSLGSREVYSGLSPGLLHMVWWTSQLTLIKETPFLLPNPVPPSDLLSDQGSRAAGLPCYAWDGLFHLESYFPVLGLTYPQVKVSG